MWNGIFYLTLLFSLAVSQGAHALDITSNRAAVDAYHHFLPDYYEAASSPVFENFTTVDTVLSASITVAFVDESPSMRWFRSQLQLTVRVQHAQNPLLYNADLILLSDIAPNPIAEKNDTVENDNISTETKNTLGSTSTVDQPVQNANADNEFLARIQRSTVAALLQNMKLVKAELRSDAPLPVPGSPVTDDAVLTRLRAVMLPSLQRVQQDDGRRLGVGESKQELRAEDIVIESITQMAVLYNRSFQAPPQLQGGRLRTGENIILVQRSATFNYPSYFGVEYSVRVSLGSNVPAVLLRVLNAAHSAEAWSVVAVTRDRPFDATVFDRGTHPGVRFMTYNIWNYSPPWQRRLMELAETIRRANGEIVAIQELRNDHRNQDEGWHQMTQLTRALPEYPYFAFAPAHYEYDGTMQPPVLLHEGVGIISKIPLFNFTYLPLSRRLFGDSQDAHNRTILHAAAQLGNGHVLHVYNTHMSLSPIARERNVQEILEFIDVQDSQSDPRFPAAHAFTGDFNTLPNATEIRTILAAGFTDVWSGQEQDLDGERRHSYASAGDALGGFAAAGFDADALSPHRMASTAQLSCRPDGMTFPADNPRKRIDFIFVRPSRTSPAPVHITHACVPQTLVEPEFMASDHNALFADLII